MYDILGILGEIVLSPYGYGVIIDTHKNEYQISHKDGKDIYFNFNELVPVGREIKKELLKDKEFKKHYNKIIKQLAAY